MALGQPLIVRSPIAGEVVKDRIVIGQYMKEDAEPVAVIADLSKVWVVAHVKEKDLSLIQALDEVEIRLVAMPDKTDIGKDLSHQRDAGPRYPFGGGLDRVR